MADLRHSDTKLSVFIEACLEPLPDETLIDTQYNSMVRQERREAWRTAFARVDFYSSLLSASYRIAAPFNPVSDKDVHIPSPGVLVKRWRKALIAAMLTPAEYKADIAWKRRNLKRARYGSISEDELLAAIAADEAFFAAHPVKRSRRRAGQ